ncbi:hypothetical protein UlMin_008497 [Ulmus minor]
MMIIEEIHTNGIEEEKRSRPIISGKQLDIKVGDALIQLYHNFITEFETKINLLKLAHFVVIVSRQYPKKEAAISYLKGVIKKLRVTREQRIEEPILYIKMQIDCKKLLDNGKSTLNSMTDIDPFVYANYYWVSSQYYKVRQEFTEFYKSALLYLAYTSVESLSDSFKLDLAFNLSLSSLLGDNIYNFGELLAHPIIRSLIGSKVEWLFVSFSLHMNVLLMETKFSEKGVSLRLKMEFGYICLISIWGRFRLKTLKDRIKSKFKN